MRSSMLPIVALLLSAALVAVPVAEANAVPAGADQNALATAKAKAKKKGKAKQKRCRKGYVLKTVKVKRKRKLVRVKRCRKRAKKPGAATPAPKAPAPAPGTPPSTNAPAVDPNAARAFVEGKLADSRFTNCPDGFGLGCPIEFRYSHFANRAFHSCQLRIGPPRNLVSTYTLRNPAVGSDGSWSFETVVPEDGGESTYRWQVAADGKVSGTYTSAGDPPTELLALHHVAGARDCAS